MPTVKAKSKSKSKRKGLSEQQKKLFALGSGSVVLITGLWWAYYHFTTVPPPDLKAPGAAQRVDQVAEYLGMDRGFGRLSTPQQEQFLLSAWQVYGNDSQARSRFSQDLRQMTSSQREVLAKGIFDISREHVLQHAREYASVTPAQRSQYIDRAYKDFQNLRTQLSGQKVGGNPGGGVGSGDDVSAPLKDTMPQNSDELYKSLVDNTSGKERSEAKPFVDAMIAKHREEQQRGKKR